MEASEGLFHRTVADQPEHGKEELAPTAFRIAALAFALLTLPSRELTNPAVKQFHEQLAGGQYVAIYDGADETLRRTAFVNLLQSVHQKLGEVQELNLTRTVITLHGGGVKSIGLTYDTKFTYGTGTEKFVWQKDDNHVTLGLYQIKSKVLTVK